MRREFGVAQRGKRAAQTGEHEREHQARSGVMRAQPREHEDAGADDRADAQRGELKGPERALQAVFACFFGLRQQRADWLLGKQTTGHARSSV